MPSLPVGALPLRELPRLVASVKAGDEVEAPLALTLLSFCFQDPEALAASFRRGDGSGPPDFMAVAGAVGSITSFAGSDDAEGSPPKHVEADVPSELRTLHARHAHV